MKVIIVEDEQLAADNLEKLLVSIDAGIEVLAKLDSVRSTVQWLTHAACDLIFLDIQLSDGISFSIFEQLEVKIPVIFTTAYDQFALKAFKLNSIDYLLKPINLDELRQSLAKFKEFHQNKTVPDIQKLIQAIRQTEQYQERFLVNAGQKLRSVKVSETAYFYAREKAVFLCTFENKHYDIDYTLEKLQEILDPKKFFRINRHLIVNIEAIVAMHTVSKSRLKLELKPTTQDEVIVSFNNVQEFKRWLNN
jgi:DNA-binding LytR/AlgR family response regulator